MARIAPAGLVAGVRFSTAANAQFHHQDTKTTKTASPSLAGRRTPGRRDSVFPGGFRPAAPRGDGEPAGGLASDPVPDAAGARRPHGL